MGMLKVIQHKIGNNNGRINTPRQMQNCINYVSTKEYFVLNSEDGLPLRDRHIFSVKQFEEITEKEPERMSEFHKITKTRDDLMWSNRGQSINTFVRDCVSRNKVRYPKWSNDMKRIATHFVVSFHPNDVGKGNVILTPENALAFMKEYCCKVFNNYDFAISVHIDHMNLHGTEGGIHCHIVINNISNVYPFYRDDKIIDFPVHKYHDGSNLDFDVRYSGMDREYCKNNPFHYSLPQAKAELDKQLLEYGWEWSTYRASQIRERTKAENTKDLNELLTNDIRENGQSLHNKMRMDIDEVLQKVRTEKEFKKAMNEKGYSIRDRNGNYLISFKVEAEERKQKAVSTNTLDTINGQHLFKYGKFDILERCKDNLNKNKLALLQYEYNEEISNEIESQDIDLNKEQITYEPECEVERDRTPVDITQSKGIDKENKNTQDDDDDTQDDGRRSYRKVSDKELIDVLEIIRKKVERNNELQVAENERHSPYRRDIGEDEKPKKGTGSTQSD